MQYFRNDTFLKELGKRVRERRKALKLTQADVAFELNVPTSWVGFVERGQRNFSVSYLPELARVLKLTTSELVEH